MHKIENVPQHQPNQTIEPDSCIELHDERWQARTALRGPVTDHPTLARKLGQMPIARAIESPTGDNFGHHIRNLSRFMCTAA